MTENNWKKISDSTDILDQMIAESIATARISENFSTVSVAPIIDQRRTN